MHGRLKVRTSAEEAIRKKKEHDLKAKAYRHGMDKIFAMRAANQLDQTLLDIAAKILSVNPDLSTLWNIRRECILKMIAVDEPDYSIFDRDLGFTESCLMVQPKSYGAWHHRVWILENCPTPDWDREVKLCTTYLKKDERNCKFDCIDIASSMIHFFVLQFMFGTIVAMSLRRRRCQLTWSWNFAMTRSGKTFPTTRRGTTNRCCFRSCIPMKATQRDQFQKRS